MKKIPSSDWKHSQDYGDLADLLEKKFMIPARGFFFFVFAAFCFTDVLGLIRGRLTPNHISLPLSVAVSGIVVGVRFAETFVCVNRHCHLIEEEQMGYRHGSTRFPFGILELI